MKRNRLAALVFGGGLALLGAIAPSAKAENYIWPAYCEYTEYGSATPAASMPCTMEYLGNGYEIIWQDGVYNRFTRSDDSAQIYTDLLDGQVYRYYDEYTGGDIFNMEAGQVAVYPVEW